MIARRSKSSRIGYTLLLVVMTAAAPPTAEHGVDTPHSARVVASSVKPRVRLYFKSDLAPARCSGDVLPSADKQDPAWVLADADCLGREGSAIAAVEGKFKETVECRIISFDKQKLVICRLPDPTRKEAAPIARACLPKELQEPLRDLEPKPLVCDAGVALSSATPAAPTPAAITTPTAVPTVPSHSESQVVPREPPLKTPRVPPSPKETYVFVGPPVPSPTPTSRASAPPMPSVSAQSAPEASRIPEPVALPTSRDAVSTPVVAPRATYTSPVAPTKIASPTPGPRSTAAPEPTVVSPKAKRRVGRGDEISTPPSPSRPPLERTPSTSYRAKPTSGPDPLLAAARATAKAPTPLPDVRTKRPRPLFKWGIPYSSAFSSDDHN